MIGTILLDAFGTLFDTSELHVEATKRILDNHNLDIDPSDFHTKWDEIIVDQWKGYNFKMLWPMFEECLEKTFRFYGVDSFDTRAGIIEWLELVAGADTFPEVIPTLDKLRSSYRLVILSNTDNYEINKVLQGSGLSFEAVITSEDTKSYKPRKEIFDHAFSLLGVKPDETVIVGDSIGSDILGAKNAGIKSIWINRYNRKLSADMPQPDIALTDLSGLPEAIEKLNSN
ncbi:MAG TPA: HAD family hydrolase [bacterium]|nr:HAD family hydrolase [bacterium]